MLSIKTMSLCDTADWAAEISLKKYLKEVNKKGVINSQNQKGRLRLEYISGTPRLFKLDAQFIRLSQATPAGSYSRWVAKIHRKNCDLELTFLSISHIIINIWLRLGIWVFNEKIA